MVEQTVVLKEKDKMSLEKMTVNVVGPDGTLLTLSGLHAAATNDVQRAAYVAAANYASAVLASRTEVFYSIVDLSVGILVIGLVILAEFEAAMFGDTSWLPCPLTLPGETAHETFPMGQSASFSASSFASP